MNEWPTAFLAMSSFNHSEVSSTVQPKEKLASVQCLAQGHFSRLSDKSVSLCPLQWFKDHSSGSSLLVMSVLLLFIIRQFVWCQRKLLQQTFPHSSASLGEKKQEHWNITYCRCFQKTLMFIDCMWYVIGIFALFQKHFVAQCGSVGSSFWSCNTDPRYVFILLMAVNSPGWKCGWV